MNEYLDIDWLKSQKFSDPFYFGLGFIQFKLNDLERLHFWHPDFVPMEPEQIHNHRYDFTSKILAGSIENEIFEWYDFYNPISAPYEMILVSCKEEDKKTFPDVLRVGDLFKTTSFIIAKGGEYFLHRNIFHRSSLVKETNGAITFLKRSFPEIPQACVIRKRNSESTCLFSKKIPTEECWEIIKEIIKNTNSSSPGYHLSNIQKGELGKISKIIEELQEFEDATQQNAKIMQLIELSDTIGAIESFLENNHPEIKLEDLVKMSDITKRAFKNGFRD